MLVAAHPPRRPWSTVGLSDETSAGTGAPVLPLGGARRAVQHRVSRAGLELAPRRALSDMADGLDVTIMRAGAREPQLPDLAHAASGTGPVCLQPCPRTRYGRAAKRGGSGDAGRLPALNDARKWRLVDSPHNQGVVPGEVVPGFALRGDCGSSRIRSVARQEDRATSRSFDCLQVKRMKIMHYQNGGLMAGNYLNDVLMYYPSRNYNPNIGRFTSFDSFDGDTSNPITTNHYLYANANPVSIIDPTGHEGEGLIGALSTIAIGASLNAIQLSAVAPAYVDALVNMTAIQLIQDSETLQSEATSGVEAAAIYVGYLVDVTPFGRIRRYVPAWVSTRQLANYVYHLVDETLQDAPTTLKAARAAFAFSESILKDSIQVAQHTAGADITARVGSKVLAREFSVFRSSNIDNLYGKILDEAHQTRTADIQQVFIHVYDRVINQPGGLNSIRENAKAAVDELAKLGRKVTVTIVGDEGQQLFPLVRGDLPNN